MNRRFLLTGLVMLLVFGSAGWSYYQLASSAPGMTKAAQKFLATLDDDQLKIAQLPYDTPQRVGWHFIPKDERKGLQIRDMSEPQRKAAHGLLKSALSNVGYGKAEQIMELEGLLHELEKARQGGPLRDTQRYYFTIFGEVDGSSRWGLSVEGHHLSLNFVVQGDQVASSTPAFFGANPGLVMDAGAGVEKGTRVLKDEELLAFELVNSLSDQQRSQAVIAEQAPREIRAAGEPQPPTEESAGIAVSQLKPEQVAILKRLVQSYAQNMPKDVAQRRIERIRDAGPENVHFAWAGALKPGVGHYYRVQGPTFLIEFVNTQPDAAGNPANHIHCVWRDMAGDFALPLQ